VARTLKKKLLAWMCGLAAVSLFAPFCPAQRYSFATVTEGLGNLNINCIAEDRTGYLWIGTENGLYRYDGSSFKQYGAAEGLGGHTVQSLFVGLDGTLFVGTTSGIYFELKNGNFAEINPPGTVKQFSQRIGSVFTAISPDQVAVADRNGAFLLEHVETDRWAAAPMHLDGTKIWSVIAGPGTPPRGSVLWYGCDQDLCRRVDGKTTHMGALLHLPEDRWLHLLFDREGHLWIRGFSHVVEVFTAENRIESHELPGHSDEVPYGALAEDASGHILVSRGPDLGLLEKGQWRMVTARNGLTHNDISAVFVDREGSIWMAMVGHGLMRWVGQDRWEGYTAADGLSDDVVWSTLRDKSGRLWIGTESGVDYIPAGGDTPKTWQAPGIETGRAVSMAESTDGAIWMGSAVGNLVRIDPGTLAATQWKLPEVYRALSDGGHRLWIATTGGLYAVDVASGSRAPQLVEDPAIPDPKKRFTDLCLDPNKALWAASDQGLFRLDASGWHRIDPGLSAINPLEIAADQRGNLWASGAFAGIRRLKITGDKVVESERITRPQLLSDQVVSLAVDRRGWVWVGQDNGLTVYNGRSWRGFIQDDGLIWKDTDSYALYEDRDGSMWIGTSGGVSHLLQPQSGPPLTPQAPVFSGIAIGGAAVASGTEFPWTGNPLAISMEAIGFRDARQIRIRYRLLGLESEWVETGDKIVRYPRLDPGTYRFQAQTVDRMSGAVSAVSEIAFRITPRWWQSGPLRLGLILLISIVVVLVWQWRVHHLVEQKRRLEIAVHNRTEDLEREKAELQRAEEKMRQYAEHDDLTGLWNHRIVIERLHQEMDRSRRDGVPLSIILADLDHFKNINDTYGHQAGDKVLQEISAIFQRAVRAYDSVGRYGGEEFLLILPGLSFVGARLRAEQFRMAIQAAHIHHGETAIQVTASFGVASGFPEDYEAMIHAADASLYRAKNNGRNCVMASEIGLAGRSGGTTI
jgi:diguanylate cyclase (GGDEF)-like protein